jgi:hypothetical protein
MWHLKKLYRIQEFTTKWIIVYKFVQLLAYDDNLDMISRIVVDLMEAFLSLVETAEENGLKGESFVYLVTMVNSDGGAMMDIKVGLGSANAILALMKHFSSKLLSSEVKCLIYRTQIRPVLTY